MQLITHADASHHSKSQSQPRYRACGVHYFRDNAEDAGVNDNTIIIDVVCAVAFESEYAALFISCQKAVVLR
jgi:hypothetical protein